MWDFFACLHLGCFWQTLQPIFCVVPCFVSTLVDMNAEEKKRVNEKKGSTDRIWAKKPEVVKGNESIPVSLQPLSRIIAVVFFSGWEMPKRTAQTKRLPLLLFYYNISFLTIPCLSLSQASPLRVRQRKRFFIERKKGCHLGDKREKWWHYDVPVMLIKIRKSVHSAMSQIQNNNLLC